MNEFTSAVAPATVRDRVISNCIKAINLKYAQFTQSLSTEANTTNLGTDLLSQGLSTAASIVTKPGLTRKLAGGSALALGVGSTFNKDIFYRQTLPAILASMDARRSKVLESIARSQNADPSGKVYTLARAGLDLDLLQQAGSMNIAIQELTSTAVANAAEADAERQAAERNIEIGTEQATPEEINRRFRAAVKVVQSLEGQSDAAKLTLIANSLGLAPKPNETAKVLSALIRIHIAGVRTMAPDRQEAFMQKVEAALGPYRQGN